MSRKKKRMLTDMDTRAVALVRRGANKKRFALFKGEEGADMDDMREILEAVLETEVDEEAQIEEVIKQKLSAKGMNAVKGALRMLNAFKDELPKDVLSMLGKLAGYPAPKAAQEKPEKPEDEDKYPKPKTATKKDDDEPEAKPDLEGLDDKAKQQVEALWKAREDDRKERERLQKELAEERSVRRRKEFVAKAASDFSHVPGKSTEELGDMLLEIHEASPELGEKVEEILKSVESTMEASDLLAETGRVSRGETGDAWSKIEAAGDRAVQKSNAKITRSQAIDQYLKTPDGKRLYAQYLADNPAQVRGVKS